MVVMAGDLFRNLSLLENVAGTPMQLFLPHTVIFQNNVLHSWYYSDSVRTTALCLDVLNCLQEAARSLQNGVVTRRSQEQLDIKSIQNAFAEAMHQNPGNSCFVAVAYYRNAKPQLLRRHGFTELCNAIERYTEASGDLKPSMGIPDVIQSYVPPLLDAVYTTTYCMSSGVPTVDTQQTMFSSAVEEPPAVHGRRPSVPTQPVPSAPSQLSSALKRRLRQIALALAAHFRSNRRLSNSFTFHCLRDARSRFCITALYQKAGASKPGGKHVATLGSAIPQPEASWSQSLVHSSVLSNRNAYGSQDGASSDMDASQYTKSHAHSVAPSSQGSSQYSQGLTERESHATRRPRSANSKLLQNNSPRQSVRCSSRTRPHSAMAGACRTARSNHTAQDQVRGSESKQGPPTNGKQSPLFGRGNIVEAVDRRGVPRVIDSLVSELETMRGDLVFQHEVIESHSRRANKAEGELEAVQSTCNARLQSMQAKLEAASAELTTLRAEHRASAQQATNANERARLLEAQVKELTAMVDSERATTIKALGEYQNREGALTRRVQTLEAELSSTKESLKQEQAAVNAMKNQTVTLSEELQQVHKEYPPATAADAGVLHVLASISQLLGKESNPAGERYAVQKVIISHSQELRSTFLYYCQLDSSFTQHWPPSMMQHQFLAFCRDSETADTRAGAARGRSSSAGMLPISEAQEAFDIFANNEDGARDYATLPYEGFISSLIWISSRLKSHPSAFLSEAFRTYILRHVHKAKKVVPSTPRATKGPGMLSPGPMSSPSATGGVSSRSKRRM